MRWLILVIIFSLASCVKNVDKYSHRLILNKDDQTILNKQCHEIEQIGDLSEYLRFIKQETNKMFQLIDEMDDEIDNTEKIIVISEKISEAVEKARALIGEDYTAPRWNYEVKWQINQKDFKKFIGNYLPNGLEVTKIKPISASLFGERNDELLKGLRYKFAKKNVDFSYKNKGSSLEICQLQKTRMLLVEVHYRHTIGNNKRFFNLIHR